MRKIQLWIMALLISAVFLSCSTVHRTVSVKTSHTDSTQSVSATITSLRSVDSTVKLTSDSSWSKVTEIDYGIDTVKTDSAPIFKPYIKKVTIKESGNLQKTDTASKVEKENIKADTKSNTQVIKDTREKLVDKTRKTVPGFVYIIGVAILALIIWLAVKYLKKKV